jgi:hypothetical protein
VFTGICLLATVALGAACSDVVATGCVSDDECSGDRVCHEGACTDVDNGLRDHDVFGQIMWEVTDTDVTGYSGLPGQSGRGFQIRAFLHQDGRATVFYEEGVLGHGFNSTGPPFSENNPDTRTRIDTSWSVEDDEMVVGDVLRCTHEVLQERDTLQCELLRAIVSEIASEEAAGATVRLEPGREPASPGDEEFEGFSSE